MRPSALVAALPLVLLAPAASEGQEPTTAGYQEAAYGFLECVVSQGDPDSCIDEAWVIARTLDPDLPRPSPVPAAEKQKAPTTDGTAAAKAYMDCVEAFGASSLHCVDERETWMQAMGREGAGASLDYIEQRRTDFLNRRPPPRPSVIPHTPIETHESVVIDDSLNSIQIRGYAQLVRDSGYRCDSITLVRRMFFTGNHKFWCNGGRYKYLVKDKGGRLVVEVD